MRHSLFAVPLILLLAACGAIPDSAPPQQGGAVRPPDAGVRQCMAGLARAQVRFEPLPDRFHGGGCKAVGAVKLIHYGVPTTNLGPMTCTLASQFTGWMRDAARPIARRHYGADIARVETYGTYSCRNVNGGRTGRLSEHASANAIDLAAFVLSDGRRVSVLDGWNGERRDRAFLRDLHQSACGRFGTVLGPDYNRQHANHFHFDMNSGSYCR